jgi:eukaryotic-like serine/threonine-protein kinase
VLGVRPGMVLGERYSLRHRLSESRSVEHWSAHDATLRREVALIFVGAEHPNKAGVLDAARRAAGVEDTRLVRILDVGTQNGNSFVVQEALNGSESLTTVLLQGPLPAEEARRIAGEAAKGLEAAGVRGLHHLRLTPHHVLIAPDGAIRVTGVAIAAAIDGPDEQELDSAEALRRDAVCLVAIVYAGLTTRWPLDEKVSGLEPAPRIVEGVVAPSKIVAGTPDDLDDLCVMTLNKSAGPLTPGVVASRVAPWPRERVHRAGVDPTVILRLPSSGEVTEHVPVVAVGTEPTVAISRHDVATQEPSSSPTKHVTPPQPFSPVPSAGPKDSASHSKGLGSTAAPATLRDKTTAAGATTTKALATALSSAGAATNVLTGKLGAFAKGAAQKGVPTAATQEGEPPKLAVGLSGRLEDLGPPLPLLPASTALPPSRGQSKIVVLVVAAFVAVALYFGYRGMLGMNGLSLSTAQSTVSAPGIKTPASPAPQGGAEAAGPIAILSATGFDPQGDQKENNSQAAKVYDGNPATTWTSELYNTPQFGDLKKGVGLLLDLGQPTSVHRVTIDLANGPLDVTAYAATGPSLQGATVIGEASAANGRIHLKAAGTMPESQFVIVWFTSLAPYGGQFGASVQEIALN